MLIYCALFTPVIVLAQDSSGPPLNAKFHEDFRKGDPKNPAVRPIRDGNFVWENGGAHVMIPAGQGKIPTTGIAANFKIKGDFEITASYEILKAEKPSDGYGVGVILYVAIDPDNMHAVSLSRRHMPKGNTMFVADRMKAGDGKPEHLIRTRPSKATTGKLRVKRIGAMLSFHVAEGDSAEFQAIYQDGKSKKIDVEFGNGEIRYFQIGGDAGDSESALDLRLLDLTVHAEELPGYETTPAKNVPPSPSPPSPSRPSFSPQPTAAPASSNWTLIGIGMGACVFLAGSGIGAFFILRKRKTPDGAVKTKADATKKPIVEKSAPPKATAEKPAVPGIPVKCECGRKLKVKTALAGKKIKCPECGGSLSVPRS